MTPKEKAKELVETFGLHIGESYGYNLNKAKQCALIHVNEIIEILKDFSGYHYGIEEKLNFYIDVRDEIEKL